MQAIEEKVGNNVRAVLKHAQDEDCLPREAAVDIAMARVRKAMELRRWSLF